MPHGRGHRIARTRRTARGRPHGAGRAFLHVPSTTQVGDVTPTAFGLSYELRFSGWRATGEMETFVCRTCGIVELHVKAPGEVTPDGKLVHAIDPEPAPPRRGPFR